VSAATGLVAALVNGVALGLQFNPLTSLLGCVIASIVAGYPAAPDSRRPIAVSLLALAWLGGDGARIGRALGTGGDLALVGLAVWALTSALVGYALPGASGIGVGRRVVRGTGWLSAGAVAFAVSGALTVVGPAVATGLRRMAGVG
jgi:hypothetical protein